MWNTSNCRGCTAPMVWALTVNDSKIPLDPDPVEEGQFYLVEQDDGSPLAVHVRNRKADDYEGQHDGLRYMPHHATCPKVDQFRGRRGNAIGIAMVFAVLSAGWGVVGFGVGAWWCARLESPRIEANRLEVEVRYASRIVGLGTELAVCSAGIKRAEEIVDSVHYWLHGVTPPRPGRTVVGLPRTADGG